MAATTGLVSLGEALGLKWERSGAVDAKAAALRKACWQERPVVRCPMQWAKDRELAAGHAMSRAGAVRVKKKKKLLRRLA